MNRARHILVGLVLACTLGGLPRAAEPRVARVTYVTGSSVYLDAGSAEGLEAATRLELLRDGERVATLEVREVSTHRALCAVVESIVDPAVGDEVRFVAATPPTPATSTRDDTATRPRAARSRQGIRGRIGVRYLVVDDRRSPEGGYSQPALDLRLDSGNLAGGWGFAVDARTRRTYRDTAGAEDESRTRLYRMAATHQAPDGPWSLTVGRQYSPRLAAVSIFDGVSAEYQSRRWSAGAITGTQPDAKDFGFSGAIREHGLYVRFTGPSAGRRWEVLSGAIASYTEGEINREFVYLQGRYTGKRLWAYLAEEIDYNRGWRKELEGDTFSPTSTFVSLGCEVTRALSLRAGFDNRRNVRLFRDRVTPVTDFDDEFRQGAWAGAWLRFLEHVRLGLDARVNGGGSAGDAESYSATVGVDGLRPWKLGLRTRTTRYTSDRVEGWLYSADVSVQPGGVLQLTLSGGRREEDNLVTLPLQNTIDWYGLAADIALGRRWYLLLEAERTDGDLEQVDQYYTTLSYRF